VIGRGYVWIVTMDGVVVSVHASEEGAAGGLDWAKRTPGRPSDAVLAVEKWRVQQ
jgi:hypothetical protein